MKKLSYSIGIRASKELVWQTMLDSKKYKKWAKAFSLDSQFDGEWKQNTYIKFIDPNMGGTKALIEEIAPFNRIQVKHVAVIGKDGREETESDVANNWMGITETYSLRENYGLTELSIEINTHEDYEKMFNDAWPNALELLKDMCERYG